MKARRVLLVIIVGLISLAKGVYGDESLSGPLWSRSIYPHFLIYYHLPGMQAKIEPEGHLKIGSAFYCAQGFINYETNGGGAETSYYRLIDYENITIENMLSYSPFSSMELGITLRWIIYYGGFLDMVVQAFHNLWGFPNNNREHFPQNDLFIDIKNKNNITLSLEDPVFGFGDIDLWAKINIWDIDFLVISALCAVKLPTGNLATLTGSGYPDFALALLLDWYIFNNFALYLNIGIIVPYDCLIAETETQPFAMFNGLVAIEYGISDWLSLLAQLNVRTSPIEGKIYTSDSIDFFAIPQTDLLIGTVIKTGNLSIQFYFQEDPFTHNTTDVTFNLAFIYKVLAQD